jgi:hypothetical protein
VYGALLLLMLVLLRDDRRSTVLLGAAGLGVGAVALSVLVRLLGSNPGVLFLGGRLNAPLGYINGEGCLFVMGFWLCMAAAESRRALVSGPAAGLATLMACLALLSQSRGTALAMLSSLIVVVALVPGRTRRVYALLAVAGAVALAAPDLSRVYSDTAGGPVAVGVGHAAGRAALLAALAVGIVWAALTAGWEFVCSRGTGGYRAPAIGSWLLVVPAVLALAVAAGSAHRIEHDVRDQWHAFTHLVGPPGAGTSSSTQPRLLSGAGNRYDYWRIAWRVWRKHPLLGVGAGNYSRPYYEQRATTEDIEQPHSVELQALSELGLVGTLLLAGSIAGVLWGAVRMRRQAARAPLQRSLMAGGLGAFVAWLAQTSVDWIHLLPGLTAIAVAGATVLVMPRPLRGVQDTLGSRQPLSSTGRETERSWARRVLASRTTMALGGSIVLATLVVAGASLSRQGLAGFYRARAQHELQAHPEVALADANRSLGIDSDAVQVYYVRAAALARFDQAPAVEAALRAALVREPDNFVTWTLLGDVAVREQRLRAAKHDYARAHQFNPRNSTLLKLAADPTVTLP